MMFSFAASTAALLLLANSVLATPIPRQAGRFNFGGFRPSPSPKGGCCSIANATVPDITGAGLADPGVAPTFITVGLGTQNYTCGAAGTYTSTGAVADIFDIACLNGTPAFATIQDDVLRTGRAPRGAPLIGKHFFIPTATGGIAPKWDFTASQKDPNAFVVVKKDNGVPAPTGPQDVQWLQLSGIEGGLASAVYRLDTRGGQPPASCTAGTPDITVKYSSTYWFFKSSIQPLVQQ